MNLAGEDQRPAVLQAMERPCSVRAKGGSFSRQTGRKTGPPPVPTAIRGAQRSPASQVAEPRVPRGLSCAARSLGTTGGDAVPPLGREGAPGSRHTAGALRRRCVPLPAESLHATPQTEHPPGSGALQGRGAGGVAARGRNHNPVPAPAAHLPLPRTPAAPLRRYRESQRGADPARVELPPAR